MNRKGAKELWPIIKAFGEGKDIQYRAGAYDNWYSGDAFSFDQPPGEYRIKPEPREFYVYITCKGGTFVSRDNSVPTSSSTEIIKVREVIE